MRFSNREQQQEASGFDGTPTSLSSATSAGKPSAIFTTADLGCSIDPVSESLLALFARLRSSEDGLTSEEAD
jgi:hypothetical protein